MMPVRRPQQWLPSIFNDFFDNNLMTRANATAPAVNVIENENDYRVELAVPGMTKDDFKVYNCAVGEEIVLVLVELPIDEGDEITCGYYVFADDRLENMVRFFTEKIHARTFPHKKRGERRCRLPFRRFYSIVGR